jgi:uncharacterized membrane protein
MVMALKSFFKVLLIGLLGAVADAIPGISGGTVYYVPEIYEQMFELLNGPCLWW